MSTTSSSSPGSVSTSNSYTPSEWTQQTMLSDLMQQKGLLIGACVAIVGLWLLGRSRSKPEQKAARRLVRDWRRVDDVDDVRELLGENVPAIVRPAMLMALHELERQVQRAFRRLEKEVESL